MTNQSTFSPVLPLLCPPGNGVFTVHAGQEKKAKLHQLLYQTNSEGQVKKKWEKSWKKFEEAELCLLGIPSDCGGGILRGANWGPLSLRENLDEKMYLSAFDMGDIRVIPHLLHDKYLNSTTIRNCRKALYDSLISKHPVSPLSMTENVAEWFFRHYPEKKLLSFGGDHSVSYPLIKAWLKEKKKLKQKVGILHFDAHTDLLDQRLGVDLCFGTWTSHILPYLPPYHLVQVGIRSTGKTKSYWEQKKKVKQIWTKEVRQEGAEKTTKKLIAHYKKLKIESLYLTFDIDALDEKYAATTGTPEPEGLFPHEAIFIMETLKKSFSIEAADIVEVAPYVFPDHIHPSDRAASLQIAGQLATKMMEILL